MQHQPSGGPAVQPRRVGWVGKDWRHLGEALLYLGPSLFLFMVFIFVPLGQSVYLSLFYTNPLGAPISFGGLDQYGELFESETFRTGLVGTFRFVLYTVPGVIGLALLLAVLANQRLRGLSVFRTMLGSTIAVSAAVGTLIWLLMFNPSLGLLNYMLSIVGVRGPNWLIDPSWGVVAVSITTIWLTLGFNIIVLLSGLQSIPEDLYESAKIDGAVGLNTFRHITVPLLSPSLFFLMVVDSVNVFQAFTQIHLLTRGGPVDTTRVLVYSIYLDAFQNFRFGSASAQAMVLFVIILALTILQFRFVERRVHYQ